MSVEVGNASSRSTGTASSSAHPFVVRLAQFFPEATPVRLPVSVSVDTGSSEQTVIEFGTGMEVLFASGLPLEFGERVRLRNVDGSLDTEAFVVAMEFQGKQTAIAARFAHEISNWIVKP